jgi:biotin synthase-like enzyme
VHLPNTKIYNNNLVVELRINLGWFTDEQALKLQNLFLSTNVYLHNLQENTFNAVIVTDKSFEEKRYKDNKAINKYSIKVEYNQLKNIK